MGLCWLLLRQVDLSELWLLWRQLHPSQLSLLLGLNSLILVGLTVRWHLLIRAAGYRVPFALLFCYRLAAFGITYFTPGPQFGGEPLQVYLLHKRHALPLQSAIATVTLDKVLEMVANFGFLVGGALLLLNQGRATTQLGYQSLVGALLLLALPLYLLGALARGKQPVTLLWQRLPPWLVRQLRPAQHHWFNRTGRLIAESEHQLTLLCQRHPLLVALALLVTLLSWGLMLLEFAYAARLFGALFTPAQVVLVLMAARVAYLLPMPAGIGTFETSLVLAFRWLEMTPTAGLALSLLIRARDLFLGAVGLGLGGAAFIFRGQAAAEQQVKQHIADGEASPGQDDFLLK